MCVCLFVHVFTFEVPFKRLFARTSQNLIFKIFRDLESLGKIAGNNWSQILNFLLIKGLKLPRQNKFFSDKFRLKYSVIIRSIKSRFVWYRCYYPHRSRDPLSPVYGIFFYFIFFIYLKSNLVFKLL